MKKIKFTVLAIITILVFASCQQIFTYSVLEWAQRDPANLPPEQQIAYAETILTSGDTEAMADAYDVINDLLADNPDDVDLQLLAADLAIGGSGITDAIADLDLDNLDVSVETILEDIDLDLVAAAADHVIAAEALSTSSAHLNCFPFIFTTLGPLPLIIISAAGLVQVSTPAQSGGSP